MTKKNVKNYYYANYIIYPCFGFLIFIMEIQPYTHFNHCEDLKKHIEEENT